MKGEAVDEVVFIMSGCLEILEDDDVVIAILSNGDAFGNQVWKVLTFPLSENKHL